MFCNKCGKFIKDDTDFCPECGNKIVRETKVDNNVTFCNQCGKKIEGDTVFCPGCGNKIVSNTVTPTVTTNNTFQVNTNVAQRNISNVNTNVNQVPYQQPVQPQYQAPTQNQYYANQYNNQYTYRKKSSGGGIGAFIVLLLVGFLGFKFIGNGGDVIIDQPIEPNGYEETPPTQRGGSGKTVLNIENRLFNKRINSSSDVLNYIREDGETKRKSCPSEIKSIEEKIQSEFGITAVNLCEIDVNFAKGLYEGVKWAYQQFPQIRGKLTNLTIANMENMGGTIAYFRPIFDFIYDGSNADNSSRLGLKMTIAVNAEYYLNENKFAQSVSQGSKSGHFPPNATKYSPLVHEFGHCASYVAMMKMKGISSVLIYDASNQTVIEDIMDDFSVGTTSQKLIKEAYNEYLKDGNQQMDINAWRATISQYAVYKNQQNEYIYDETIAEAVHDVYLNGNNAKPASRYIFNTLKKYVG